MKLLIPHEVEVAVEVVALGRVVAEAVGEVEAAAVAEEVKSGV